jgi:hypothetical protein
VTGAAEAARASAFAGTGTSPVPTGLRSIASRTTAGTSAAFMKTTCERKIAAHVCVSTTPVTASACEDWKRLTARSVIGPKMPSSSTPMRRCTCATVTPVLPKRSRVALAAPRDSSTSPVSADPPLCAVATDRTGAIGDVATAPVNATADALRRWRCLRPARPCGRWRALVGALPQGVSSARSRSPGASYTCSRLDHGTDSPPDVSRSRPTRE